MKKLRDQIEETYDKLKEIGLEIADDLQIQDDLGGNYSCFVDKELYKEFQKLNEKHNKLHEKLQKEEEKQLKFALK